MRFLLTIALALLVTCAARAESVKDTCESLDRSIQELTDLRDRIEEYRDDLEDEDDLAGVVDDLRHARATMRNVAISLLIASIHGAADWERTQPALEILLPGITKPRVGVFDDLPPPPTAGAAHSGKVRR